MALNRCVIIVAPKRGQHVPAWVSVGQHALGSTCQHWTTWVSMVLSRCVTIVAPAYNGAAILF